MLKTKRQLTRGIAGISITVVTFLVFLLSASISNGQTIDSLLAVKLQSALDSMQTVHNVEGISASVLIPEQGIWSGASGFSHEDVPINIDMLFGIGSNTKTFTAVLLLKLQEEDLLNLDDTTGQWIPEHPFIDPAITVRQLLNHTSGLYNYSDHPDYPDSILSNPYRIWQPEEMLQFIKSPLFPPGEDWGYCNTNYLLAGMIAKEVGGENEEVSPLFQHYIFAPLELDSTFLSIEEELKGEIAHRWIAGHDLYHIPINSAFSAAWTSGAIFSTSKEMVQWYNALMDDQVINQASLKQMRTFVGPNDYGLGISQKILAERTVWGHTGEIRGYHSITIYDTLLHVSISVLINQSADQSPAPAVLVAEELLRILANSLVSIKDDSLMPSKDSYELFQNYPNPFSGSTTICYQIPVSGRVSLKVYDAASRKVLTLADEIQSVGEHSIIWDAERLTSGIYLVRLEIDASSITRKAVVLY